MYNWVESQSCMQQNDDDKGQHGRQHRGILILTCSKMHSLCTICLVVVSLNHPCAPYVSCMHGASILSVTSAITVIDFRLRLLSYFRLQLQPKRDIACNPPLHPIFLNAGMSVKDHAEIDPGQVS